MTTSEIVIKLLAKGLVFAGAGILTAAYVSVRRLITLLPRGQLRRQWYALSALIVLFIAGYLTYVILFWRRPAGYLDLLVPGVFFLGATFVWFVAALSIQTAADIRRVSLLEQENITDPLIGIYNRRYLDRRLDEECARARRYEMPLSVLMLDVDHFKQVNDTYGHQTGDQVLIFLGKLLVEEIRETDMVARYGGEEILVVAPNTSLDSALELAERLREAVEKHKAPVIGEPELEQAVHITVSIGVASLCPEGDDRNMIVNCADRALLRAKQEGRNRVSMGRVARQE